jgi:putative ABC transport system permease protein
MQIEDNVRAGLNPAEARYAAIRSFGPMEPTKEQYRDRRSLMLIETTIQDVRYSVRTLRNSPGFTLTSVIVLALAIGANSAMFSVLDAVLFRKLPFRAPEQLAMLWTESPSQSIREGRSAYWSFEQWRRQTKTFADMAVFDPVSVTLTAAGNAERIGVVRISPNFFSLLGVQPFQGRMFSVHDFAQRQSVAIISHRFWKSRFAGSQSVIGSTIDLDGVPCQIIGILPATFEFPLVDPEVWQPYTAFPDWEKRRVQRGSGSWFVIGRLRTDATLDQAQAEMTTIARRLDLELPASERNRGVSVVPIAAQIAPPKSRLALWMLTGAVLCVLLIAATNVAGLWLARNAARAREFAVRTALGASRARIVRQLLAEGVTLAVVSGLLALIVAAVSMRAMVAAQAPGLARLDHIALNLRVLGWTSALCLLTGFVVGLAPALTIARSNLRSSTDERGRGISAGISTTRIRRVLVVAEFALAMILLAGGGLLIRSLWLLENVELGFRPEGVLSVQLSAPPLIPVMQRAAFYKRILEEVESIPGAESVGIIENLFISGSPEQVVSATGAAENTIANFRFRADEVSGGFFKTLGTPLLNGRFFSADDRPDSPRVAIINEAMAKRLWPGMNPVGQKFKSGAADSDASWVTVVGVVGDMRRQGLETEPIPQVFQPLAQNPPRLATLLVRTSLDDPLNMAGAIQAAVHRIEKSAAVYGVTTLEGRLGAFLQTRRFQTSLLICFSLVALVIAAIGIYGLIQYSVAIRTHEIGIRLAVGAQTGDVLRIIVGDGLKLTLAGLAVGLGGALSLSPVASSLLFGVSPTDPVTFVAVSLLLAFVATTASYLPARRAMKVDPVEALRHD